jgi:PIN domain nuclease of toxin-antitoxin system
MIVLDTHIWIWWTDGSLSLSPTARNTLEQAVKDQTPLLVPAWSCWEFAMLVEKGRLILSPGVTPIDWLGRALSQPMIELSPVTPEIAVDSVSLPGDFHGDPADRIVVATARIRQARFATEDGKIRAWAAAPARVNLAW